MTRVKLTQARENVFCALGIDEPEEYQQKADLAIRINDIISEAKLTQNKAANILGLDQPKISLLKRGLLDGFSIERLMKFLRLLGDEHEIRPKRNQSFEQQNVMATTSYSLSTADQPRRANSGVGESNEATSGAPCKDLAAATFPSSLWTSNQGHFDLKTIGGVGQAEKSL